MKYMGWSWEDLGEAPQGLVDEIIVLINEEIEERKS